MVDVPSISADPASDSVRLIEESPTEALKDQFSYRDSALSARFVSYIKASRLFALLSFSLSLCLSVEDWSLLSLF